MLIPVMMKTEKKLAANVVSASSCEFEIALDNPLFPPTLPKQLQRRHIAVLKHEDRWHRHFDRRARTHLSTNAMLSIQSPKRVDG